MDYNTLLFIHIVSVVLLLGVGGGSAFYKFMVDGCLFTNLHEKNGSFGSKRAERFRQRVSSISELLDWAWGILISSNGWSFLSDDNELCITYPSINTMERLLESKGFLNGYFFSPCLPSLLG